MLNSAGRAGGPKTRCAVYCRVSTDDGLSQAFTSLDAQQSSGESFIAARKAEGWELVAEKFHDGGYSGGNLDRPGLQNLLRRVEEGRVEAIVVYKLDRFTRSIRDFGRLADVLEKHRVALVSVTQSIDTGTSMGRLMMHVLLSFAAFERELASERTRDKIALSRQKGRWTGGRPPLGYDIKDSNLVVNPAEAAIVRALYAKYLELSSLSKVIAWANERGIRNKSWTTRSGDRAGGLRFFKSTLAKLLSNPLLVGLVPHKGATYSGIHTGIVDPEVFKRVQQMLAVNGGCGPSLLRNRYGGLLKGLLVCGCCGGPMVHTVTKKKRPGASQGVEYRYYACLKKQSGGVKRCRGGSVQAEQIESFVIGKVKDGFASERLVTLVLDTARAETDAKLRELDARRRALESEVAGRCEAPMRERPEVEAELKRVAQEQSDRASGLLDRAAVRRGLREFDGLWASLPPAARAKALALLIRSVRFDAGKGEVGIVTHDGGTHTEAAA